MNVSNSIKALIIFYLIFVNGLLTGCSQQRSIQRERFAESLERNVVRELNLARQNPARYAAFLEQLKPYYVGKYIKRPGKPAIITNEGVAALDEAIRFLKYAKPVGALKYSEGLSRAALDHVLDQGPTGKTGHLGTDGKNFQQRIRKYGEWKNTIGENIAYGRNDARDIIAGLIIDDGVPGRGHRKNIFNPEFKAVGVAFGSHALYSYMCVTDFAGGFIEKNKR